MSGSCQRLRLPTFAAMGSGLTGRSVGHGSPQHRRSSRPTNNSRPAIAGGSSSSGAAAAAVEQHRVIMMGSERVGKTSIVSQFLYDRYSSRYRRTTEDLHRGEYELADGASLTLDILDTCGAMEFPAMRRLSIQFGDAFLLVYAVNDAETWKEVETLRAVILESRGPAVPIVVVGNKCDVDGTHRQIAGDEAESIARHEWRCGYVECSAKENVGIVEVFKALLKQANISYNLSPAVRRRRLSLPALPGQAPAAAPTGVAAKATGKYSMKRHSCTVA